MRSVLAVALLGSAAFAGGARPGKPVTLTFSTPGGVTPSFVPQATPWWGPGYRPPLVWNPVFVPVVVLAPRAQPPPAPPEPPPPPPEPPAPVVI
ncbi:MAG: hypothetical protein K1X89_29290, partial [Myxococcaceae bacterium]|nr:hypothetical protein [Myxococcaceae bacterium]